MRNLRLRQVKLIRDRIQTQVCLTPKATKFPRASHATLQVWIGFWAAHRAESHIFIPKTQPRQDPLTKTFLIFLCHVSVTFQAFLWHLTIQSCSLSCQNAYGVEIPCLQRNYFSIVSYIQYYFVLDLDGQTIKIGRYSVFLPTISALLDPVGDFSWFT